MPFAHTHREDFSKKNGVCQLFSRRFTGICGNLSISGKIKPLNRLLPYQGFFSPRGDGHRPFRNAPTGRFVTDCYKLFKILIAAYFRGFPSGGKLCRVAAVMRGAAYYAQPIFDCLNIPEGISENQGAQPIFDCLNIFDKKFLKIKGQLQNRTAPLFVKVSFPEIL